MLSCKYTIFSALSPFFCVIFWKISLNPQDNLLLFLSFSNLIKTTEYQFPPNPTNFLESSPTLLLLRPWWQEEVWLLQNLGLYYSKSLNIKNQQKLRRKAKKARREAKKARREVKKRGRVFWESPRFSEKYGRNSQENRRFQELNLEGKCKSNCYPFCKEAFLFEKQQNMTLLLRDILNKLHNKSHI